MNIFWLHTNGRVMALLHADAHAVKMILEIAQLCSNVYYHYMQEDVECKVYKKTHAHHPMSVFVCQNKRNFVLSPPRPGHRQGVHASLWQDTSARRF